MRGNILLPLLFVVIAFAIVLTSGSMLNKSATDPSEKFDEATASTSTTGKKNLQLKDLTFTNRPTPAESSCNHDNGKPIVNSGEPYDPNSPTCKCLQYVIECTNRKCSKFISIGGIPEPTIANPNPNQPCGQNQAMFDGWCQAPGLTGQGEGLYCLGKPVIYLYPQKPTLVDVTVRTTGKIIVSDPQIEQDKWTNVMAHPNGILFYKGNPYRELFYETESKELRQPSSGIVIEKKNLKIGLLSFITRLGLTRADEQDEFLDWWLPQLEALDSPYVFVSILERDEKDRLDKVSIDPKPDTFIDFIVYFKPLTNPMKVEPLRLPPTPERIGFTAVEWGGVIDKK